MKQPYPIRDRKENLLTARPFLKWAGGKGQLLEQIDKYLPTELKEGSIKRYIEPFVGGGAVFLYLAQTYHTQEFYISDVNRELILAYKTIQKDVEGVIRVLSEIQARYYALNAESRKKYFYQLRTKFNSSRKSIDFHEFSDSWIERTAQIIFLNRTCFNGLFRVNSQGEFNVPAGRYKQPRICDSDNLRAVSRILQRARIYAGDYIKCADFVNQDSFVYFDPPYKPISKTANFTAYSQYNFDDAEQLRLRDFYCQLDRKGAKLALSNSDPKNEDPNDDFFEKAYKDYKIQRIKAARNINSNASKRGQISELLITNY